MLFKLLWLVVLAWIAYKVMLAGRELFRITAGRAPERADPRFGPERERRDESGRVTIHRPSGNAARSRDDADVEDAKWREL